MKQIRKRLTYANVMSSLAVFLILGGATAFAASKIGTNEIKANAITTGKIKKEAVTTSKIKKSAVNGSKVKDGSLTGSDLDLTTLGTVPSASNANAVNGQTISKILFRTTSNAGTVGPQVVFNAGGLIINATCSGGNATVSATTTKNDSSIYIDVFPDIATEYLNEVWESGEFDIGVTANLLAGGTGNNDLSIFEYDAVDGSVVTGMINTDEDGALQGCRVTGHATVG